MNTKVIISIVVIVVIAALSFFFFTNQTEAPTEENQPLTNQVPAPGFEGVDEMIVSDTSATVTYTDKGFNPKELTIKKGETVTFTNESSRGMWVGSAMHPTHAVYPEKSTSDCLGSSFDQCEVNANGESWEFTFNEAGTWGYHNHVRAGDTGKIIVE